MLNSWGSLRLNPVNNELTLQYVQEALLTPATKLYKTVGFFEKEGAIQSDDLNAFWDVLISDTQISQADGTAAAQYFYSGFLGCGYPASSARTTKLFYDATKEFLNDLDISEEKRVDLHNALNSYLVHESTGLVSPTDFANRYFEQEERDSFSDYLEDKNIPSTSFTKDLLHIESSIKTRKISFRKKVNITAPANAFKELVQIESVNEDDQGNEVRWTKILIKDEIISQE